ncbi:MAG: DUF1573 domain-containing protein [Verrucomicrobiales bacterium]
MPSEEFYAAYDRIIPEIDKSIALTQSILAENTLSTKSKALPHAMIGEKILIGDLGSLGKYVKVLEDEFGFKLTPDEQSKITAYDKSELTVSEPKLALGPVAPGSRHERQITLSNSGRHPIDISWVRMGRNCKVQNLPSGTIEPDTEIPLDLVITVPSAPGAWNSAITVYHSGTSRSEVIELTGDVTSEQPIVLHSESVEHGLARQ